MCARALRGAPSRGQHLHVVVPSGRPRASACARRGCVAAAGGGGGGFDKLLNALADARRKLEWELNFENWAPRGARAYRLREIPKDLLQRDADKSRPSASTTSLDDTDAALSQEVRERLAALVEPGKGLLSGRELAQLCVAKYGFAYDMAIKTVSFTGITRIVALNLYCAHLGQRSFPYTDEEYIAKLDAVAYMINAFNCADFVRAFFASAITPRGGLPSRPRVDTAVTLRLNGAPNFDGALVEAVFAAGNFE